MVEINNIDSNKLVRAVLLWTGYKTEFSPSREDATLNGEFEPAEIQQIIQIVKALEDDFYKSEVHLTAPSLGEMAEMSEAEFQEKYPRLPKEIAEAFGWCYTFDYK